MTEPLDLLGYFHALGDAPLSLLQQIVEIESCSNDTHGLNRLADFLAGEFDSAGASVELVPLPDKSHALKAVWRGTGAGKPILLLGHLDTVWPAGTLAERPFHVQDGKASGPGIYDMKSGLLLCLLLCRSMWHGLVKPDRDVTFFFSPDEEIGSHGSLPILEQVARESRAVLCLEPPLPGGKAKTFRKGVGTCHLRIAGIAAHAGVEPGNGASAVLELSRQILALQRMNRPAQGISVTVGTIKGGSASNVVPASAEAEVDFRFPSLIQGRHLEKRIRGLRPRDERCRIEILGGINRPPLERTDGVVGLFLLARKLAARIGMDLGEGATGGGSDGSFTAALGIPTLDGLGVEGDGAHAVHEHILISDVPLRAALLGMLVQEV